MAFSPLVQMEPMGAVWGKLDLQVKEKEESFQKSGFGGF